MREYRRLIVSSVFMTFFVLGVVLATNSLESSKSWSNYQNTEGATGLWQNSGGNWSGATQHSSAYGGGANFQPLSIKNLVYGIDDLITTNSNSLEVLQFVTGAGLVPIFEFDLGSAQAFQASAAVTGSGTVIIIPTVDNKIHEILYNSSGLYELLAQDITALNSSQVLISGVVCSSYGTPDKCYFATNDGGINGRIWTFNPQYLNFSSFPALNLNTQHLKNKVFPVYDWDSNGRLDIAVLEDVGNVSLTTPHLVISVYDLVTGTKTKTGSQNITLWNGVDTFNHVSNIMFYNADGYANSDVFLGYSDTGAGETVGILKMAYDGTVTKIPLYTINPIWRDPTAEVNDFGNIAAGTFTAYRRQICMNYLGNYNGGATVYNGLKCIDTVNNSIIFSSAGGYDFAWAKKNWFAADFTGDYLDDFVSDSGIYDLKNNVTLAFSGSTGGYVIAGDFNYDGFYDVGSSSSSSSYFNSADIINFGAPTTNSTNYVYYVGNLGKSFVNPICTGQSINFYGYECGFGFPTCNYISYVGRTERLVSNCGGIVNNHEGNLSLGTPFVNCVFNNAGNYLVAVYIQDQYHLTDYSQVQYSSVQVVNGTFGVNCGTIAPPSQILGSNTTTPTTSTEESSFINLLTGGNSSFVKGILVLVLLLGLTLFLATKGVTNPYVIGMINVVALILCATLGLISWGIIMLIGFLIVGLVAVAWLFGGGAGGA